MRLPWKRYEEELLGGKPAEKKSKGQKTRGKTAESPTIPGLEA